MYLLDTNACLDFLLARDPRIAPRISAAFGSLIVSTISLAELRVGDRESQDPEGDQRNLDRFVAGIQVMPFDQEAATIYGKMMRAIALKRTNFDRLIAAHALRLDVVLVTNNSRHFADVPGLRVENWTQ